MHTYPCTDFFPIALRGPRTTSPRSSVHALIFWGPGRLQVLVVGKVSQAVVVAGAAYRDSEAFARITGIANTQMIDDKGKTDVQVHAQSVNILRV
jgi:hypothetical protein